MARSNPRSWIRHQALQIAAQLPEDAQSALKILEEARKLVIDGMDDGDDAGEKVVSLVTS
jgi:predicted nuclease with TOPRIM domain